MPDTGTSPDFRAFASSLATRQAPVPVRLGPAGKRLVVLLAAVLTLLAASFAAITALDHDAALDDAWSTAERAALGSAEQAEHSLAASALIVERATAALRDGGPAEIARLLQAELPSMLRHVPQIGAVTLWDAGGRRQGGVGDGDPADRRPEEGGAGPVPLEWDPATRSWRLVQIRPLMRRDGEALGTMRIAMRLREFERFHAGLNLGSGGRAGLFRAADGAPLAVFPLPMPPPGTVTPPPPMGPPPGLLDAVTAAGAAEGRFAATRLDGTRMLVAWRRAGEGGSLLATAAVPRAVALAPFRARLLRHALLFSLAAAVVTGLGAAVAASLARAARIRRAAEAGRRELSLLLEATRDGVIALDRAWRITFVNARAAAWIAGGRELRGLALHDALMPDLAVSIAAFCRPTMEGRATHAAEGLLTPPGRRFRVESHPREDGGIVAFFRDVTEEREAIARIEESEARLRRLFHAIDEGYCLCEMVPDAAGEPADYRFLEVNPLFAPMTGLGDAVGRTARELIPALDNHWVATFARVAIGGETLRFEQRTKVTGLWLDIFATPVAPRGRFALVFRDVTARRAAESALRESEARLRRAQEAGGIGLWEWEAARPGEAFWSQPQRRLLGLPPDAPASIGGFLDVVHPDDREALAAAFRHAIRTEGAPFEAEFRIHRADTGEERWLGGRGEVERDASGRAIRMVGVNLDVTDRRRAEVALATSEARLRLAQEAADVGVFERDLIAGHAHWSPAMFRLYGLDPTRHSPRVNDEEYLRFLHPDDLEQHRTRRDSMRADPGQSRFAFEFRIRRPDTGEVRWLGSSGEVVRDAAGRAVLVRGVNHDVTERRRSEERQMLLAREVDHRAKNALAVVQAIVGLTRHADPEAFRAAVIGRIAAMARAHTLLARDGWKSAELCELITEELAPHRADAAGGPDRVTLSGPVVSLLPAAVQPLAMALHELATNAAKYGALSSPAGHVRITWARTPDGGLELRWAEGGGPRVDAPPSHRGFGSSVIRNTVERQLGGGSSFDWRPEGLACTLTLPAKQVRWAEARVPELEGAPQPLS